LGNNVILLQALELTLKRHARVKVGELGAVNQDSGLDRVERIILDPFFKVVDLHVLSHIRDSELVESIQLIVLLNVGSTVLVKIVVIVVTTVVQVLEGCNDVTVHGADLVATKEEGV
jgi:hypothetical protein